MARIVGGLTTSHIPAIGNAIARKMFEDPYWKPFFDGYPPVREWLDEVKPDVAVVIYNDHGLNFFLDKQPTFAIGAAPEYRNDDEGWGIPTIAPFKGDPAFSWHLIDNLVHDDFDLVTCQEMLVDHGFTVPMQLFWPNYADIGIKTVPLVINTVQHPLPSPRRCYNLGKSLGKAIESYPEDLKVVILGTGGLSHQLDGQRAGFINKTFDRMCMEKIVDDPEHFLDMSIRDLVVEAGAQGAEFILWLAMRGALTGKVTARHSNYHIPISNTASGLLCLENAA
ncbi:protocatechuate 4,5-dioxygenase beta chain [Rhodobium orientis]|uniref:Protocatechuate 3,4-dioxygenase n=1 Tax=Rhodobium orientis TaxID=34017 RepID=A0A327JUL9_9HYPH|nr:class III extradiol dioxygenase family protein [Rhodobium orientis]MBB4302543.1 protocatechuate 4,5-dioxygenase beta chain [Rhodobium orientis]MBK5949392.1 protocatechuate 3,4-dioxygenase [Rhodobium orientis]RAI29173.1 protocatechuate 3,4-dioxygenase [Rhodobium orientis]